MADNLTIDQIVDHSAGWDWEKKHVTGSFNDEAVNGSGKNISIYDIIESGTVLICAGPADLEASATDPLAGVRIVPIGLVETAQINMNKPLSRIFEIGSKLSYIIPGRTVGGIALNRVFFDGPSLLKAIYAGEILEDGGENDVSGKSVTFMSDTTRTFGQNDIPPLDHIGSGNIAMNLASSFFDNPVGLAFIFHDRGNNNAGQIYFEGCRVSAYNMGISANMNVLTEAINMEFIRCRPIITSALGDYNIITSV